MLSPREAAAAGGGLAQDKLALPAPDGTSKPEASMRVTLLGTGGPELSPERRQGAATLVEAGGQTLLFDAGRGVLQLSTRAESPSTK